MRKAAITKLFEGHEPRQQTFRAWTWRLLILLVGVVAAFLLSFWVVLPRLYHLALFFGILATYVLAAYLLIPLLWRLYWQIRLPKDLPAQAKDPWGIPGDPLNVALVGSKRQVLTVMSLLGWQPVDPINIISAFRYASRVLLRRAYNRPPMNPLYVWGRKPDFAFQLTNVNTPRKRHHVRFWQANKLIDGARVWVGAVHFDRRLGISWLTGQLTHHIRPHVDEERDALVRSLKQLGLAKKVYTVAIPGAVRKGSNAGGDRFYSDGKLKVVVL